ncbi:hypothetical protein E0Z10_g5730 [Xylaria hypoxylon]|uniref:Uncharacterized protein n=1 Tax=Xylaria hypoxylon TaxID=37992 RepID=A0A4Z0Z323_9PEZI|nr:hypothetical protein E0Z10_g5730 [Xylaria hypoxylon]
MCERETRKRKLVRNRHNFESDSSDDEWSDWEEVPLDEGFNGGDPPMTATGAYPHILPSIEEENDDSRADDLPETPDPVTEKRADKPSTPIRIQEPEICATQVKVSRKARRRIKHDKRRTRNKNVDRRRSRILASSCLSNACDGSAHRPAPNQLRVQNRAVERTGARKGKSLELPSPSAPKVRPFIDFMSPAATVTPDPDTESLFRMKGLLCDEHGRSNSVSVSKASRNLQRRGTTSTRKNTATKDRDKDVATANARNDTNPHTVQPVRGTPLILIEENERQARKLAMPLVPTKIPSRVPPRKKKSPLRAPQVHREVRPKIFYSSLTRDATVTPRENPEAQVGGVSQPKCPEHTRDAAGARSGIENEENRSKERRKGATPDNIPRRRSLSHQSYRSNDTFPSIEELYRREIQKRTTTTQTQPQSRTHTQIQPETTGRKGNDRKRPRGEPSSKYHDPSTKRSKIAVGPSSPVSSAVAEWAKGVDHANSPINDTKRKRAEEVEEQKAQLEDKFSR